MNKRYYFLSMLVFLILSIFINRVPITAPGYNQFYDKTELIDLTSFRNDFLSLWKSHQSLYLDVTKRVFLEWIFLFMDEQQFDVIRYPLQAFLVLAISYHFFLRFIENEKYAMGEEEKHVISIVGAFFYLANPLSLEHYISLYPEFSYALFPAAVYWMYMTFRSGDPKYPILLGLISSLLVALVIHNALYLVVTAACFFLVAFAGGKADIKGTVYRGFLAIGTFIALSLFMILPVVYISLERSAPEPGYINSIDDVLTYSRDAGMLRILLQDLNLNSTASVHYEYPLGNAFYPVMALVTACVIGGALYYRNALAVAAGLNFAVFSLLANGINSPAGGLYEYAALNLPLGWLIRQSPKFAFLLPMFFGILLIHLLSVLSKKNRKAFAACCLMAVLSQSIFSNVLWEGDLGGSVVKRVPDSEFVDVIGILKSDNESEGKVAWYGDFALSSPRESWLTSFNSRVVPLRFLIWNPDPSRTVSQLAEALEVKYILIDRNPVHPYFHFSYAWGSIADLGEKFTPVYEGERSVLLRVGDNLSRFYVPKTAFLVYSGYDSVHAISRQAPLKTDIALIMADDGASIAEKASPYADVAVFDSKNALPIRLDERKVISFGKNTTLRNGRLGWARGNTRSDLFTTDWLRELEVRHLEFDFNDYGRGLVFTSPISSYWSFDEKNRLLGEDEIRFRGTEQAYRSQDADGFWLRMERFPAGEFRALRVIGTAVPSNLSDFRIDVYFFDSEGEYIDDIWVSGGNRTVSFNRTVIVPKNATFAQVRALAHSEEPGRDIEIRDLEIYGTDYDPVEYTERFGIAEEGDYDLYLRIFKSPHGGSLGVEVNNGSVNNITTLSDIAGFEWVRSYSGPLGRDNTITLTNNEGLNAVNIGYAKSRKDEDGLLDGKGILYIYEAEKEFEGQKAKTMKSALASGGREVSLKKTAGLESKLQIYDSRLYHMKYRGEQVSVMIDGKRINGSVFLEKGPHEIEVKAGTNQAKLDYVLLMDDKALEIFESLKNGSMEARGEISGYRSTGRSSYDVNVTTYKPALLVFTAGYDPLFLAASDGESIAPIPVFTTVNAFPLPAAGSKTLAVEYVPQKFFEAGLAFSIVSLVSVSGYLLWRWRDG